MPEKVQRPRARTKQLRHVQRRCARASPPIPPSPADRLRIVSRGHARFHQALPVKTLPPLFGFSRFAGRRTRQQALPRVPAGECGLVADNKVGLRARATAGHDLTIRSSRHRFAASAGRGMIVACRRRKSARLNSGVRFHEDLSLANRACYRCVPSEHLWLLPI